MIPFSDDSAVLAVKTQGGELSIENGLGEILISGAIAIARDRRSLAAARALAGTLGAIVTALDAADRKAPLPEIAPEAAATALAVKGPNPF